MLRLYTDHNVSAAIVSGLRVAGVDVLTAFEDDSHELADPDLLIRVVASGRILFTHDDDFLVLGTQRQRDGLYFTGIIFAHQMRVPIGVCIEHLELVAKASEAHELENRILHLPL